MISFLHVTTRGMHISFLMLVPCKTYFSICYHINTLRVSSFNTVYSGCTKRVACVRLCTVSVKITSEQGMILTLQMNMGNLTKTFGKLLLGTLLCALTC